MFGKDWESTLKNDRVRNMIEIGPAIAGFVSYPAKFSWKHPYHQAPLKTSFTESPLILAVNKQGGLVGFYECVKDDIILFGMVKHVYSMFIPVGKTSSKMIKWLQILVDASELRRAPVEICSWSYVPGSKLPLFLYIKGLSST